MYRQEEECMMKKTLRQLGMAVALASVFSMTACSSQVGKQAETTKAETGTSAESQENIKLKKSRGDFPTARRQRILCIIP